MTASAAGSTQAPATPRVDVARKATIVAFPATDEAGRLVQPTSAFPIHAHPRRPGVLPTRLEESPACAGLSTCSTGAAARAWRAPGDPVVASGERILQDHGVFAVRAGGDDADRAPRQLLQRTQVGAGRGGQFVPGGDAVGGFAPAGELQVDRGDLFPALGVQRGVLGALAAVLVGDADLQLLHAVEHVELGDAQAGDAVDGHGALEGDDVHPAAAARAAGGGAVLGAAVADALADLVVQLGRERAAADAGGVGLGDAQHVVDV